MTPADIRLTGPLTGHDIHRLWRDEMQDFADYFVDSTDLDYSEEIKLLRDWWESHLEHLQKKIDDLAETEIAEMQAQLHADTPF